MTVIVDYCGKTALVTVSQLFDLSETATGRYSSLHRLPSRLGTDRPWPGSTIRVEAEELASPSSAKWPRVREKASNERVQRCPPADSFARFGQRLLAAGADIALTYGSTPKNEINALLQTLRTDYPGVVFEAFQLDGTSSASYSALIRDVASSTTFKGSLDIVIANAGVSLHIDAEDMVRTVFGSA